MLSASAYSFRQKSRLAISLSWVAGYTNVITFALCGQVISHVTGNTTHFGRRLAAADLRGTLFFGFLIGAFFTGAVASALMTEGARRRGARSKYMLPLAVEGVLLSVLAVAISLLRLDAEHRVADYTGLSWLLTGTSAFAMGLQNATITRISGAVVRTTHLTGVVTDLGLEGVQYLLWAWERTRGGKAGAPPPGRVGRVIRASSRQPTLLRLALLGSIFGSFLFGAVLGTVLFAYFPSRAMLGPVGFLVFIIVADWRKPVADVKELDLLADPEWAGYASVKSILPPDLGIYRLTHPRRRKHGTPDMGAWVQRLPGHWRVVILAVSPLTAFDADSVLDLTAAVRDLRSRRRDLILCGLHPPQYRALHRGGLTRLLGLENVCPDLDFAIARGLNRVRELTAEPPG